MKRWKTYQIIVLALICIAVNYGGRTLALHFQWPFWMDTLGTMLYA